MKKNRIRQLSIWGAVLMLLTGCGAGRGLQSIPCTVSFFAMDTYMELKVYGKRAKEAAEAAKEEILRLDALFSVGNENSEISQVNSSGETLLSEDTYTVLEESEKLFDETGGAFDITVYPLVRLWGFGTGEYRVPSSEELDEALLLTDAGKIVLDSTRKTITLGPGQKIDLGGIAKGYASDRAADVLKQYGITSAWISLGGNIETVGAKPDGSRWRIGIRDPKGDEGSYFAVIPTENQVVITSGNYERFFVDEANGRRYHHIIDPSTGYPADNGLCSVTIVGDNGMEADGLSTSLFILGLEKGADFWREHSGEFEAVFMTEDGEVYVTEGLEDCVICERQYSVIRKNIEKEEEKN